MQQEIISVSQEWTNTKLAIIRFLVVYFVAYIFPFPLDLIPYGGILWKSFSDFAFSQVETISKSFQGSDYAGLVRPNGSGDTTYNYIQVFFFLITALVIAAIWSVADRKKRLDYHRLFFWFLILLRYYLALMMISYGLAKVFKTQFPFPSPLRLTQPYGDSSPMGLLWTFMGYSTAYNVFTGLGEFVGGVLLFFRRTTMLGALIVIVVMSNVVALNFTYDVPVKLFSIHLLLMAFIILTPDLPRIIHFFLTRQPIGTRELETVLQ